MKRVRRVMYQTWIPYLSLPLLIVCVTIANSEPVQG